MSSALANVNAKTTRCDGALSGCTTVDIKDLLAALDQTAKAQADVVSAIATSIKKYNSSRKAKQTAADLVSEAKALYTQQWTLIWTNFPNQILICTQGCQTVSKTSIISMLNSGSRELLAIANRGVRVLNQGTSSAARKAATRRKSEALKSSQAFEKKSAQLPDTESKC